MLDHFFGSELDGVNVVFITKGLVGAFRGPFGWGICHIRGRHPAFMKFFSLRMVFLHNKKTVKGSLVEYQRHSDALINVFIIYVWSREPYHVCANNHREK
jgi:hypothetical protein